MGLDPDNAGKASPNTNFFSPTQTPSNTPGGGVSQEELVRRSNYWRDNYNPLRGLTIARLMYLFEQSERGAFVETQLTLRKAEKRFPVLRGFEEKLVSHIKELESKVRVKEQLPEGATPAMAEAQRKFLQSRYDLLKNLKTSICQLALADLRGYAVLQKHRYQGGPNDAAVEELYWLEPWCWARDGFYGDFYYNVNSLIGIGLGSCKPTLGEENRIGSVKMPREDFVIQEAEAPLYEIALISFVNWLMGRKDFASFTEIFGLPNSVVIMPPDIAKGKETAYQAAAEDVARGVSGVLPHGSSVEFPSQGVRGDSPFLPFTGAQEADLVLAGTGGVLTMLSMPTGIGKGASEEHAVAWQKIAVTKASSINDTLQRDFDAPELAAAFPGQPVCVYFALATKDVDDVSALADTVVKLEGVNLQTDASEISERTGIKLTRVAPPDPSFSADGTPTDNQNDPAAPSAKLSNRAIDDPTDLSETLAEMLLPLMKRLEAIAAIDDATIQQHMVEKLLKDFPAIEKAIQADNSLAKGLSPMLEDSLLKGLSK
jgi:hypothetical protein